MIIFINDDNRCFSIIRNLCIYKKNFSNKTQFEIFVSTMKTFKIFCVVMFLIQTTFAQVTEIVELEVKQEEEVQKLVPISDLQTCNPVMDMIVEINFDYFEDQHSVTLVDNSEISSSNIFKCLEGNKFRPIRVFNHPDEIKFNDKISTSSVAYYPLTNGFMIKMTPIETEQMIQKISDYNPLSKVMLILSCNETESKDILYRAFHHHRMFNVVILSLPEISFSSPVDLDPALLDEGLATLYLFNPFAATEEYMFLGISLSIFNVEESLQQMRDFYNQRTENLQGFNLPVSIFDYPMLSRAERRDDGSIERYSYVNGDILETIAKIMNFIPKYLNDSEEIKHGFQLKNGTFIGDLADVEYGRAELVANTRFISDAYNTSASVFLKPIDMIKLRFIIPTRQSKKSLILSVFSALDEWSMILSICLMVIFPILHSIISNFEQKIRKINIETTSLARSSAYSFALVHGISMKMPKLFSTRVCVAVILFYSLITTALYQSSILKNLNTQQQIGKIKLIEQLVYEKYSIKMPGYISALFKSRGLDKVSWMMKVTGQDNSMITSMSNDLAEIMKPKTKVAFLWPKFYQGSYLDQFYDVKTGENLFESVPDCPFEFYISLMTPKHSPFIERINMILNRYIEGGFAIRNLRLAEMDNEKIMIGRIKRGQLPKIRKAITVPDMINVFELFATMTLAALFVLIVENIFFLLGRRILNQPS